MHTRVFGWMPLVAALSMACDNDVKPTRVEQADTPESMVRQPTEKKTLDRPRTQKELATTSANIFLKNLEGRVTAGKKLIEQNPDIVSRYTMTGNALMTRARVFGDLDQLAEAVAMADEALKRQPKHTGGLLLRARALMSLHHFDKAREDAEAATAVQPLPAAEKVLADYRWNVGQHEPAMAYYREAAKKRPDIYTLARLGQLEMELGNPKAADEAMARAEIAFNNVTPIPIAWLNVQRGLIGLHSGQFEKAKVFYEEAMARIPTYPMAVEHLAEIEYLLGNTDRAIELYRKVIEQTNDPEFISALAGVLREKGDKKEADALTNLAKKRYEELLKKHPEAMAWHAAEFFLDDGGDPKRGLSLLEKNIKIRPTSQSYIALAGAQLDNNKLKDAAASIEKALAMPFKTAELFWTAAKVRTAEKKPEEAKKFIDQAKKLNPKIEVLEGSIEAPEKTE